MRELNTFKESNESIDSSLSSLGKWVSIQWSILLIVWFVLPNFSPKRAASSRLVISPWEDLDSEGKLGTDVVELRTLAHSDALIPIEASQLNCLVGPFILLMRFINLPIAIWRRIYACLIFSLSCNDGHPVKSCPVCPQIRHAQVLSNGTRLFWKSFAIALISC